MDFFKVFIFNSFICEALENGEFDYMESASEVFETDFFRFIKAKPILSRLAETYPTPRKKEDVPLLFYVSSNLSMRLHGVNAFNAFPMLVRTGGMINAFGPSAGKKLRHPDTGEITIACEGFNKKNHYDIDILIPVRRNMDIYEDAMSLFRMPDVEWVSVREPEAKQKESSCPRPSSVVKHEKKRQEKLKELKLKKPPPLPEETIIKRETAAIGKFHSWYSCPVPLAVVANREHYADDHEET